MTLSLLIHRHWRCQTCYHIPHGNSTTEHPLDRIFVEILAENQQENIQQKFLLSKFQEKIDNCGHSPILPKLR